MQGNASGGERARYAGNVANVLIDYAWAFINKKSVLPLQPPQGTYVIKINFRSCQVVIFMPVNIYFCEHSCVC